MSDFQERLRDRLEELESFAVDLVYDRRKGLGARMAGGLLRGGSQLFRALVRLRVRLYEKRVFQSHFLGCLVVVVGNLTVGGTGKTPVVEMFARQLTARGRRVAILSRGYKSRKEPLPQRLWRRLTHHAEPPPRVVSDGQQILLEPEIAGDEPTMLARNLPGVAVVCDRDRVKAGRYAIQHFGADTLILDDGYQYLRLKGGLNLVLIDTNNPFGNGCLLPRGILREPLEHLDRADYVFLTKANGRDLSAIEATVRQHAPGREIITCSHTPMSLRRIDRPGEEPLESIRGKRIAAFSGIASPEGFESLLTHLGADLVTVARFLDHHWFTDNDLARIANEALASGADGIVTTEKDAVRLKSSFRTRLPLFYLRLEVSILDGTEDFQGAINRICLPQEKAPSAANR